MVTCDMFTYVCTHTHTHTHAHTHVFSLSFSLYIFVYTYIAYIYMQVTTDLLSCPLQVRGECETEVDSTPLLCFWQNEHVWRVLICRNCSQGAREALAQADVQVKFLLDAGRAEICSLQEQVCFACSLHARTPRDGECWRGCCEKELLRSRADMLLRAMQVRVLTHQLQRVIDQKHSSQALCQGAGGVAAEARAWPGAARSETGETGAARAQDLARKAHSERETKVEPEHEPGWLQEEEGFASGGIGGSIKGRDEVDPAVSRATPAPANGSGGGQGAARTTAGTGSRDGPLLGELVTMDRSHTLPHADVAPWPPAHMLTSHVSAASIRRASCCAMYRRCCVCVCARVRACVCVRVYYTSW